MNHYETLGVSRDAVASDIRDAYRRLASQLHPDKGGDAGIMAGINKAYAVLSDEKLRAQYDETGSDSEQDSNENQARNLLISFFADMVAKNIKNGRISHVRTLLMSTLGSNRAQKSDLVRQIERLTEERETITTTNEYNAFQAVIDQAIEQHKRTIAQLETSIVIVNLAASMLDTYQSTIEEQAPEASTVSVNPWFNLAPNEQFRKDFKWRGPF